MNFLIFYLPDLNLQALIDGTSDKLVAQKWHTCSDSPALHDVASRATRHCLGHTHTHTLYNQSIQKLKKGKNQTKSGSGPFWGVHVC